MSQLELRPTVTNPNLWLPQRPPKQEWDKTRKIVLARDDNTYRFCGHRALRHMNIHHVEDSSNNEPTNLIATCVACHAVLHMGLNLGLKVIEIWEAEISQVEIVQRTRSEVKNGKLLADIRKLLPIKAGRLPPDSIDHANNLLKEIGNRDRISLAKPLCAVFVNLKRWQLE